MDEKINSVHEATEEVSSNNVTVADVFVDNQDDEVECAAANSVECTTPAVEEVECEEPAVKEVECTEPEVNLVSEPVAEVEPAVVPGASVEEIKQLLELIAPHLAAVRNQIVHYKEKDVNITKANKIMQDYREGFEEKMFKSVAMELISLRESCRKTVREFGVRQLSLDEYKKYLGFLVYDYEDLLVNLNIVIDGDKVTYNKRDISEAPVSKITLAEIEEQTYTELPEISDYSLRGIADYLASVESYYDALLKDNAVRDRAIGTYIDHAALYEQGVYQVMLYPVISRIARFYDKLSADVKECVENLTEENAGEIYCGCMTRTANALEEMLNECGVLIDEYVSDNYELRKHRLLKTVPTDDPALNGRIVKRYCDLYTMGNEVIYQMKVDVYKATT